MSLTQQEQTTGNLFHQFKSYLDEQLGEVRTEVTALKSNPAIDGETKQYIERLQNEMNEAKAQLKALQIAQAAPRVSDEKIDEAKERKAAFNKFLKAGTVRALDEKERKYIQFDHENGIQTEYKAMYEADATTGGFLTTPEYVNDMLKNIVLVSPMSGIVDMRMTSKPWIMTPRRTQTATAVRVAEQATRTETQNPKFGLLQNFPYEAYAFTLVSRTDMDDAELDLGAFLMDEFATQFAKLQGNEFINGLGSASSQAFGFLNDTTITAAKTVSASSGTIDYGSLVKVKTSLKPGYMPNATWVWTNETLGAIQQLTDSQGRPLWVPFGGTLPDTIFNRPYIIAPDMPQIATSAYAIAFGDFKNGYQGVVRKQVSMQVLQERYADQNAIGYFGYYRFGGTTKISEAIKVLQVHA